MYVVKSSALLKVRTLEKSFILFNDNVIVFCRKFQAVYELDKDAMLEVMEQVSNEHDWDSIQKNKNSKKLANQLYLRMSDRGQQTAWGDVEREAIVQSGGEPRQSQVGALHYFLEY